MVALFIGLGRLAIAASGVEAHADRGVDRNGSRRILCRCRRRHNVDALTPDRDEFRRVSFSATYQAVPDAMVFSSGSAVRPDVSGPGTWAFIPVRLAGGETVVINAGFVQNTMQDRGHAGSRGEAAHDRRAGHAVRLSPLSGKSGRADRRRKTRPGGCGSPEITLPWPVCSDGGAVAPFYIDLEQPVPASGIPKPGPLEVHLPDDHMQYAITWFGLAIALVIAFIVWLRGVRRKVPKPS